MIRKEVTNYVFRKKYVGKEIGKYASAGTNKLWLQKSYYDDVDFRTVFYSNHMISAY